MEEFVAKFYTPKPNISFDLELSEKKKISDLAFKALKGPENDQLTALKCLKVLSRSKENLEEVVNVQLLMHFMINDDQRKNDDLTSQII